MDDDNIEANLIVYYIEITIIITHLFTFTLI